MNEIGGIYLYVNGECEYATGRRGVGTTGVLTEQEERKLSEDLAYGSWPEWSGLHATPGFVDGGTFIMYDGDGSRVDCYVGCSPRPEIQAAISRFVEWPVRLADSGMLATGDMRVALAESSGPDDSEEEKYPTWSLSVPTSDILRATGADKPESSITFGDGYLITNTADTQQLRLYRDDTSLVNDGISPLVASEHRTEYHHVRMRDATPFDGPDGLIPIPRPPE